VNCYNKGLVAAKGDSKLHFAYVTDRAYWINLFDKTKPDRKQNRDPKGFLAIIV